MFNTHRRSMQARLRSAGWVPLCRMFGQKIWVGPKGELEKESAAVRRMVFPTAR